MKHSHIGGSTAARIIACPGSLRLYREHNPQDEPSEYALEGSMLHAVMERGIASMADGIGTEPGGFGVVYTREHLDKKILPAWNAFNEYLSSALDGSLLQFEQEVRVEGVVPGAFGTSDLLGRHNDVLTVLDWKFGDGITVDVVDNAQGLFYAACALETPHVRDLTRGIKWVDIVIVQPQRESDEVWDMHRVSIAEVQAFATLLRRAEKQSTILPTPFALGDHCRWCRVKAHCELQRRGLSELAFRIPGKELQELLTQAERAEEFIKDIRADAFKRLESGHDVPGWKLVPKRAQRKWIDSEVAIATLIRVGKLKRKDLIVTEPVSPSVAEKMLKSKGADPKLVDSLVSAISSGNTLAPASDPRPAVPSIAALAQLVKGR